MIKSKTSENITVIAQITNHSSTSANNERWYFQRVSKEGATPQFALLNKRYQLALTVLNGSRSDGTVMVLAPYEGYPYQKFTLVPQKNAESCRISVVQTEKSLAVAPIDSTGHDEPIAHLAQQTPNEAAEQQWTFAPVPCDPIPYQPYELVHNISGHLLGVQEASTENWVFLRLVEVRSAAAQGRVIFVPTEENRNHYYVYLKHSHKLVHVIDGGVPAGARLMQFILGPNLTDNQNQRFSIMKSVNSTSCLLATVKSRRYIGPKASDDETYPYPTGQPILQHDDEPKKGLEWLVESDGTLPSPYIPYRLKNKLSGLYMGVQGGAMHDGAKIVQTRFEATSKHQMFYIWRRPNQEQTVYMSSLKQRGKTIWVNRDDKKLYISGYSDHIQHHFNMTDVKDGERTYYRFVSVRFPDTVMMPQHEREEEEEQVVLGVMSATSPAQLWEAVPV